MTSVASRESAAAMRGTLRRPRPTLVRVKQPISHQTRGATLRLRPAGRQASRGCVACASPPYVPMTFRQHLQGHDGPPLRSTTL